MIEKDYLELHIREAAQAVGYDISDEQVEEIIKIARNVSPLIAEHPLVVVDLMCRLFPTTKINAEEAGRSTARILARGEAVRKKQTLTQSWDDFVKATRYWDLVRWIMDQLVVSLVWSKRIWRIFNGDARRKTD